MKKITVFLIAILFTGALFGQYAGQAYRYPYQFGMGAPGTVTGGVIYLKGLTSGRVQVKAPDVAGASTLFQFPGDNGTNNWFLKTDGNGVTSWATTGFTPASGSLTLSGADAITFTTTASSSLTLPTSGTLATTQNINDSLANGISLKTVTTMNSDTGSVAMSVGGGNGLRGSQVSFLPGARLGVLTNHWPHDTLYFVSGIFHVEQDSGTVTMGCKFFKHATTIPTSASTDMMSAEIVLSAATSATTTGTIINGASTPHFDVIAVYPGESVGLIVTTKSNGNMPKWMDGTVLFRKQNRSF